MNELVELMIQGCSYSMIPWRNDLTFRKIHSSYLFTQTLFRYMCFVNIFLKKYVYIKISTGGGI